MTGAPSTPQSSPPQGDASEAARPPRVDAQAAGQGGAVADESRALILALTALVLAAGLSVPVFWGGRIPLYGSISVGTMAAVAALVAGIPAFLVPYLRGPARRRPRARGWWPRLRRGLDAFALVFVHAAIAALLCLGAFTVLQDAFLGLTLDTFSASVIVGVVTALATYFLHLSASALSTYSLSSIVAVFLVSGALTSMLTAQDPRWWEQNFSALGIGDAVSASVFNLTLLLAGVVVTTLADYLTLDLQLWAAARDDYDPRRIAALKLGLILMGIFLACVGLFRVDRAMIPHNASAVGMAVVFAAIVVALPRLLPGFPRFATQMSYAALAGVVVTVLLFWPVGYYNFTAFELVATAIILIWLVVFVRIIAATVQDGTVQDGGERPPTVAPAPGEGAMR